MKIKKASVSLLRADLSQPFRTALGEHKQLENILFTLELSSGIKGFGEAAIATHITGETVQETLKNLKSIALSLTGCEIPDFLAFSAQLHEQFARNKAAVAAVEMSLVDAFTRQQKIPLWKFFGAKPNLLQTDITIVISDLKKTEETAKKFYKQGFRAFKVKIGRNEELDFKRVLSVKKVVRNSKIYLDANQGYSANQTLNFLKLLERFKITVDLIEQPVPKADFEGLKKVARLSKVPVCADESVASLADCSRIIHAKAAHAINIKFMKMGIFEAQKIVLLAKVAGLKLMIGGMMETSLSMTASAHLACGMGCFDYIDLDTPFFIKDDLANNPYLNSRGIYDLRKVKAGIGKINLENYGANS